MLNYLCILITTDSCQNLSQLYVVKRFRERAYKTIYKFIIGIYDIPSHLPRLVRPFVIVGTYNYNRKKIIYITSMLLMSRMLFAFGPVRTQTIDLEVYRAFTIYFA